MTRAARPTPIPPTCDVAFKEWWGVCRALAAGRQSLILRKGGIAEEPGTGAFRPEFEAFWLFPTHVHERQQGLREEPPAPPVDPCLAIDTLVTVDPVLWVEDLTRLEGIEAWHVWTRETVQKRFEYRRPGLWLLGVRAYRRDEPWRIEHDPAFDGCKSWVPLGRALPISGLRPVLDDDEHDRRMSDLVAAVGSTAPNAPGSGVTRHE